MAENTSTFTGAAADGTALTAVYLTQPAANVAIGLVFAGSDLPHIVHWGRPLAKPDTLLAPRQEEEVAPAVSTLMEGDLDRLDDQIKAGSKRGRRKCLRPWLGLAGALAV